MSQTYTEYCFSVSPKEPGTEILMAELADCGFDSFDETDAGVKAYILTSQDHSDLLNDIYVLNSGEFTITYQKTLIEQQDWNVKWESEFKSIEIDSTCRIRSPFHPEDSSYTYDIVVNPKMAFGTGHHETTHLMAQFLLNDELTDLRILDMGCGTGVLGILAAMRGAKTVDAIDIDPWSYKNTLENCRLNHISNIEVYEGDARLLSEQRYDRVLANINRNILLNDIPQYAKVLEEGGYLYLSGFYESDLELIKNCCAQQNLTYQTHCKRGDWIAVKCLKTM